MEIDKLEKMYKAGQTAGYKYGYNDGIKDTITYLENAGYLNKENGYNTFYNSYERLVNAIQIDSGLNPGYSFYLTVDDFINAFAKKYNYDEFDEKDFEKEAFITKIQEYIKDCKDDGESPDLETMAEVVHDALYSLQYGDTSDKDDLDAIQGDMDDRFPEGR